MAHRIQMKLGVVPDAERAPDSPDTALHVEPRVGAQTRTKGHLYLLVTSRVAGRARPRGDPPRRRRDPERVLLRRVGRDPGLPREGDPGRQQAPEPRPRAGRAGRRGPGPIGVGLAVVRDNELYVVHGRAGRGVPEPRRAPLDAARPAPRSRPARRPSVEPDVWRGEINVGDQLLLVSPAVRRAPSARMRSRTRS